MGGVYMMGPPRAKNGSHKSRTILTRHHSVTFPEDAKFFGGASHSGALGHGVIDVSFVSPFTVTDWADGEEAWNDMQRPSLISYQHAQLSRASVGEMTSASAFVIAAAQKQRMFTKAMDDIEAYVTNNIPIHLRHHFHGSEARTPSNAGDCLSYSTFTAVSNRAGSASQSVFNSRPHQSSRHHTPSTAALLRSTTSYVHEYPDPHDTERIPIRNDMVYNSRRVRTTSIAREESLDRREFEQLQWIQACMDLLEYHEAGVREAIMCEESREAGLLHSQEVGEYLRHAHMMRTSGGSKGANGAIAAGANSDGRSQQWTKAITSLTDELRHDILRDFNTRAATELSDHVSTMKALEAQLAEKLETDEAEGLHDSASIAAEREETDPVAAELLRHLRLQAKWRKKEAQRKAAESAECGEMAADGTFLYFPGIL